VISGTHINLIIRAARIRTDGKRKGDGSTLGRALGDDFLDPAFQVRAGQQHVATAFPANYANVRAQACHLPERVPTGVGLLHSNNITDFQV
jgi:hypothetical protein